MSVLHALAAAWTFLGWLPICASAIAIGDTPSRLKARQFSPESTTLILSPIQGAAFGLSILFALLTLLQLLCAFIMLVAGRRPESDFRGRVPFFGLIMLSLIWLLISFVLNAITISQIDLPTIFLTNAVYFASDFAEVASPVFMYAGLVFLLFQRDAVEEKSGAPEGANTVGIVTRIVAGVLLFIMLAAAIIYAAVFSRVANNVGPLINVVNGMYHLYIAAYLVLTVLIVVVSFLLWRQRDYQSPFHSLRRFDANVISPILIVICPILVIRALFELAVDVATAHPAFLSRINILVLEVATIVIEGLTQFIIFCVTFFLGFTLGF